MIDRCHDTAAFPYRFHANPPDSDVDVMVQFHPDAHPTFRTLDQMEAELKTISHNPTGVTKYLLARHQRNAKSVGIDFAPCRKLFA